MRGNQIWKVAGIVGGVAGIVGLTVFLATRTSSTPTLEPFDEAFAGEIAAYTTGSISREATIRVELTRDLATEDQLNLPLEETEAGSPFNFDPDIDGVTSWLDQRTLEFVPDESLPPGSLFNAELELGKLGTVPNELEVFSFQFLVMEQAAQVRTDRITPIGDAMQAYEIGGTLTTRDVADLDEVEALLVNAKQDGKTLPVEWEAQGGRKTFSFVVKEVERKASGSAVELEWDTDVVDDKDPQFEESRKVTIPGQDEFSLLRVRVVQEPQSITIQFSDPLDREQDLTGLVSLDGNDRHDFSIQANEIIIYPDYPLEGEFTLTVSDRVRSSAGRRLSEGHTTSVTFADLKPAIRFLDDGVIIPDGSSLPISFEAVNLRAVDLVLVKIHEHNVPQFLQINSLDQEEQIQRVGTIVGHERVRLDASPKAVLSNWDQYTVDVAGFLDQNDRQSVYQLIVAFNKSDSTYECGSGTLTSVQATESLQRYIDRWNSFTAGSTFSYWNFWTDFGWGSWSDREDPCHEAYYRPNRWAKRNLLASDLGVIAKRGEDGRVHVAVSNLVSTNPADDTTVRLLGYQQQELAVAETDNDGFATLRPQSGLGKPFIIVAEEGEQRGYLRLDDGQSLAVSRFDVGGERIDEGIKGMIYGERGVWRPGDTLYLTFILDDTEDTLPANHPVRFTFYDPTGKDIDTQVRSEGVNHFYRFETQTEPDAMTGDYRVEVSVGPATFRKALKIETVKPNRLKIDLDFGTELIRTSQRPSVDLTGRWLHGAPARSLNADMLVKLQSTDTAFPTWRDYGFTDPARSFDAEESEVFSGQLSEGGTVTFEPQIDVSTGAPGMLNATFTTRIYEASGDFSLDTVTMPLSPYDAYVGIKIPRGDAARSMITTDEDHPVNLVVVGPDGEKLSGSQNLEVSLFEVDWRWWWDSGSGELGNYNVSESRNALQVETISTADGEATWTLRRNFPEWGRYLLRVCDTEGGHCAGRIFFMDWPNSFAGRQRKDRPGGAAMLSVSLDKESYNVGETALLTLQTAERGRILLSLESGSKVIDQSWNQVSGDATTTLRIPITPDMAPNVYVHATLLQPHSTTANDEPIRKYGIIDLPVVDPQTVLEPTLTTPESFRPETNGTITVAAPASSPMTYTVAVVDEGLLGLTRFKTPNPHDRMYARAALGVKTWDVYDFVVGATAGEVAPLLAIGGGAADEVVDKPDVVRFEPMVRFMGPFFLEAGEDQDHTFEIPQYVGEVRVMVVAGHDQAYGMAESAVPVKSPLMVLGTLPRVLSPGERIQLPVTVFAMEDGVRNVTASLNVTEPLRLVGDSNQQLRFAEPGMDVAVFDVEVMEQIGASEVTIEAESGREKSTETINIAVRHPNPMVRDVLKGQIEPGNEWIVDVSPIGVRGTNTVTLEVYAIPPLNLTKNINYLIRYPYGCLEQLTSTGFSQLYLSDVLELSDDQLAETQHNIEDAIRRVRNHQRPDGGLAYWQGGRDTNTWGTSYAGHFVLRAQEKSYRVPQSFLANWKRYQRDAAQSWTSSTDSRAQLDQAYRLFTLALADEPELGAMNRMRDMDNLAPIAAWRLASAYAVIGEQSVGRDLVAGLSTDVPAYNELGLTFGSGLRDTALILESLSLLNDTARAEPVLKKVSDGLASDRWYSTHSTAYALMSVFQFLESGRDNEEFGVDYQFAGGSKQTLRADGLMATVELPVADLSSNALAVTHTRGSTLYVQVVREGQPMTVPLNDASYGLSLNVSYAYPNGEAVDPASLEQGSDVIVTSTIRHTGERAEYQNLALHQVFPAGWEILNERLMSAEGTQMADYKDIRDDRVYTFFGLKKNESKTFKTRVNAAYLGRFYQPIVSVGAMYDNDISARVGGGWVEVVQAGLTVSEDELSEE